MFGGAALAVIALVVGLNVMDSENYTEPAGGISSPQKPKAKSQDQDSPRPYYEENIPSDNEQSNKRNNPIVQRIENNSPRNLEEHADLPMPGGALGENLKERSFKSRLDTICQVFILKVFWVMMRLSYLRWQTN